MKSIMTITVLASLVFGGVVQATSQDHEASKNSVRLLGPTVTPVDSVPSATCIGPETRTRMKGIVDRYRTEHPERGAGQPGQLTFFPMAGRLYHDVYTQNYVDLDTTAGLLDWDCTDHTYDGHSGNDTGPRSFDEQEVGLPVYSALDGIVVWASDGYFDMNTEVVPNCWNEANAVIIDHGGDLFGYYWHHRNGSVEVAAGDVVSAGEQIALVGSSGCSTGPHLHFEIRNENNWGGDFIEPSTGDCHPGYSYWEDQQEIVRDFYVHDQGVTQVSPSQWPSPPYRWPNQAQFPLNDELIYLWQHVHNVTSGDEWMYRVWNPEGSYVEYNGTLSWTSRTGFLSWQLYLNTAGTWRAELFINGESAVDTEIIVVEEVDPDFNRVPSPISIKLQPRIPDENDVIECIVGNSILDGDPDRDVVRYRYQWSVDGVAVRDMVSAGMRDVLSAGAAGDGQLVSVTVTASDGSLESQSVSDQVAVICLECPLGACCTGNQASCTLAKELDCQQFGGQWLGPDTICAESNCPQECLGDTDGDGEVNVDDILVVIARYGVTCP